MGHFHNNKNKTSSNKFSIIDRDENISGRAEAYDAFSVAKSTV